MEVHYDAIFSALFGGGIVAMLAKAFVTRVVSDLDEISKKIAQVREQLSAITVKLDLWEEDHIDITKLDKRLSILEAEHEHGRPRKACAAD